MPVGASGHGFRRWMMTRDAAAASNIELVRDYTRRVLNEHNPELAAEFVTPDVEWHGDPSVVCAAHSPTIDRSC
jgi:hypothetical protein